jgi:hypothetical protein
MNRFLVLAAILWTISMAAAPNPLLAQPVDQSPAAQAIGGGSAPGGSGVPGGSSGNGRHHGNGNSSDTGSAPGEMPYLKPIVEPRQRLDPGALLCHTEAQLKQHQAAVLARLQGRPAQEPSGCHLVGSTTRVGIVLRDGQAVTEVQMAGEAAETGWTDAMIRDSP